MPNQSSPEGVRESAMSRGTTQFDKVLRINKSATADTRSCDFANVSKETLLTSSYQHIGDVQAAMAFFADFLLAQAEWHDSDKISGIDWFHRDFQTGFKETGWWDNHRRITRHHLLQEDGVPEDVNLIDVLEFIADCVMAGMARSGSVYALEIKPEVLMRAFQNTVERLKSSVEVAADAPKATAVCGECGIEIVHINDDFWGDASKPYEVCKGHFHRPTSRLPRSQPADAMSEDAQVDWKLVESMAEEELHCESNACPVCKMILMARTLMKSKLGENIKEKTMSTVTAPTTAESLLDRFVEVYGESRPPDSLKTEAAQLWRDYLEWTGDHWILSEEGWERGEVKQSYLDEYGPDAIIDEVNAPAPLETKGTGR